MKKLILILLLSLGFIGFSYAGGDDRDQEEFLNEPAEAVEEEAKSMLESSQGKAEQASENADEDEIKKVIAEIEHQLQEKEINEASEQEKEGYIESNQGRFIMLSIFILIIIAMYFLRRRLSKVRLDED